MRIRKAAVLGAGVMGAAIAAHLTNVGIPVLLLDIVPTELTDEEQQKGLTLASMNVRNKYAMRGLQAVQKSNPPAFYDAESVRLIQIGNFEDDLHRLQECDWVIEAVVENLAVKQQVFEKIEKVVHTGTIVSSNTSGISIAAMVQRCSEAFRRHFLGTHFFNPPRYMKLLEIIPGPDTDIQVVDFMKVFGQNVLGKGVVVAKDTPNFIANRIGTYGLLATLHAMEQFGFGVDEVDALTGPVMGRPKSATFRTLDLVGLDTFVHVAKNVQASVTDEDEHAMFAVPPYIQEMVDRRLLGEKAGQGFFKREKKSSGSDILAIDLATLSYRPRKKVQSPSFEAARRATVTAEKLKALVSGTDAASQFVWTLLKKVLLYTARIQNEIADDIVSVDNAMKWGFNWELGPYETWDAIGLVSSVERMRSEGEQIPDFVEDLLATGGTSFYQRRHGEREKFYVGKSTFQPVEEPTRFISPTQLKEQGKVIRENKGGSLIDMGDGVAFLEFHSEKQAIGADFMQMLNIAADEVSKNWDALVIGSQTADFCYGANVMLMLMEAQNENWEDIELVVHQFQQILMKLKYLDKPVVVAPFARTLGGGVELSFAADHIQAAAETYMGLVETGIGLIPGGGGNKEMLIRVIEGVEGTQDERLDNFVRQAFETIALAKVSSSAHDARKLHYLRRTDGISTRPEALLYDAKQAALHLARAGYRAPQPRSIPVIGESGAALLKVGVYGMRVSGHISEHDEKIAKQLIRVLTGGSVPRGAVVSEQYLLDLEREAFLSLIGEPKTQQRMQHTLLTNKPLRN